MAVGRVCTLKVIMNAKKPSYVKLQKTGCLERVYAIIKWANPLLRKIKFKMTSYILAGHWPTNNDQPC